MNATDDVYTGTARALAMWKSLTGCGIVPKLVSHKDLISMPNDAIVKLVIAHRDGNVEIASEMTYGGERFSVARGSGDNAEVIGVPEGFESINDVVDALVDLGIVTCVRPETEPASPSRRWFWALAFIVVGTIVATVICASLGALR